MKNDRMDVKVYHKNIHCQMAALFEYTCVNLHWRGTYEI